MQNQRATETKPTNGTKQTYVSSRTLPFDTATNPIVRLQQSIGNQAVQRLLRSRAIQPKLAISQPGDVYEQEADRVAEQMMRMPEPMIQRTRSACASGGPMCSECEPEKLVQRKTGQGSNDMAFVPDDFLSDLGPGEPLDTTTRAYFEPRFGHDFSSVRVHTDAKAAQSARKMNALAYAQGRDLVFEAAQYEPGTMAGQRLLAHELTHVVQQRAAPALAFDAASRIMKISNRGLVPNVQCDDKGKDPIEVYVDTLRTTHVIEGKGDSKQKARELIERHYKGTEYFWLPDADEYLLVAELLQGTVTDADRAAILEVLERMGTDLAKIFDPGKIKLDTLVKAFPGKAADRLTDFFARRYEGGLKAVQSGTIKTKGQFIPQGLPLSSLIVVRKLLDWLKTNKRTASTFFADSWSKNKLLLLGEMHYDDVQRVFAADMLRANGGKDTGLALEVHISLQGEIDHYIKHGTLPPGAKSWWKNDERYKKLIDAAKATNVQVIAMDTASDTDRDKHMATEVEKLAKKKTKILVYVGAMHIKEAQSGSLGGLLSAKFGGKSYAIDMFHPRKDDYIYWMIKEAFPNEKSLSFDIDASPLASHGDLDIISKTFGENLDGYVYFATDSAYK